LTLTGRPLESLDPLELEIALMKPFERRAAAAYPYFKLATWDPRSFTWRDGHTPYPSEGQARSGARKPGRYRISRIDESGRADLDPFEV
jgi:hypothetical protein